MDAAIVKLHGCPVHMLCSLLGLYYLGVIMV